MFRRFVDKISHDYNISTLKYGETKVSQRNIIVSKKLHGQNVTSMAVSR